jgi:hypothetical protein
MDPAACRDSVDERIAVSARSDAQDRGANHAVRCRWIVGSSVREAFVEFAVRIRPPGSAGSTGVCCLVSYEDTCSPRPGTADAVEAIGAAASGAVRLHVAVVALGGRSSYQRVVPIGRATTNAYPSISGPQRGSRRHGFWTTVVFLTRSSRLARRRLPDTAAKALCIRGFALVAKCSLRLLSGRPDQLSGPKRSGRHPNGCLLRKTLRHLTVVKHRHLLRYGTYDSPDRDARRVAHLEGQHVRRCRCGQDIRIVPARNHADQQRADAGPHHEPFR